MKRIEEAVHSHIDEHRTKLYRSAMIAYGISRIAVTFFGLFLAFGYCISPLLGKEVVPEFALIVFIIVLAMLCISEIIFRMSKYSAETYACKEETEKMDGCSTNTLGQLPKPGWVLHTALNFPFRGVHVFLLSVWFNLAFYYYFLWTKAVIAGAPETFISETFLFSFYVVACACVIDLLAKGIFLVRIPKLAEIMKGVAEIAGSVINQDGWFSIITKGFLRRVLRQKDNE